MGRMADMLAGEPIANKRLERMAKWSGLGETAATHLRQLVHHSERIADRVTRQRLECMRSRVTVAFTTDGTGLGTSIPVEVPLGCQWTILRMNITEATTNTGVLLGYRDSVLDANLIIVADTSQYADKEFQQPEILPPGTNLIFRAVSAPPSSTVTVNITYDELELIDSTRSVADANSMDDDPIPLGQRSESDEAIPNRVVSGQKGPWTGEQHGIRQPQAPAPYFPG